MAERNTCGSKPLTSIMKTNRAHRLQPNSQRQPGLADRMRTNYCHDDFSEEVRMIAEKLSRGLMTAVIVGVFGLGYVCGSMTQRQAEAQIGGLLDKAGKAGGPVGSVAQFGSSLVEMQDHISGLQKNLDTFKQVQSALGK